MKIEVNRTPVVVTRSNTSFVKVGERTHIMVTSTERGDHAYIWSNTLQKYEQLRWANTMWAVEYAEIVE